jgi:hypothetical protein
MIYSGLCMVFKHQEGCFTFYCIPFLFIFVFCVGVKALLNL